MSEIADLTKLPTKRNGLLDLLKKIGSLLAVAIVLTLVFAVAHLTTIRLYRYLQLAPTPLAQQVVSSLLGLFLLASIGTTLAHLFRFTGWARRMDPFTPLLRAMEQIARGDFSVRIESPPARHGNNQPLLQLFQGMNDMAQQLKQMEAMRQEFISNVSHEIQSPLTSIRGFARALQNDELNHNERRHYLTIIETESVRLSKLSDNLLALAALDAETLHLDRKPFRLDKQIRSLILACEPQWAEKCLEMVVTAEEIQLTGDENLLSQVWGNLLHNAIKFTPEAGTICVQVQPCAGGVEFRISDSGIGIAAADQERLFERFYKADKSRNRATGGSGLGLAIAKQVVEMHQGTIRVESAPGAGATFIVGLPQMQ